MHSFRFEAVYECGVSHLLSISREFDLMASWNRFVLNPCVLHEPTPFSSLLVSQAGPETCTRETWPARAQASVFVHGVLPSSARLLRHIARSLSAGVVSRVLCTASVGCSASLVQV